MIRLTVEINTVQTGGNEFGVGVRVTGNVNPRNGEEQQDVSSAHHAMVRLARRELSKRVVLGGQTTRYLERNYSVLAKCARNHGYALTVHGSMLRDVDLVAVPWVRRCKAPSTLVKSLRGIVEAMAGREKVYVRVSGKPSSKPHGRLAWSLYFSRDAYLDISVVSASLSTRSKV